MHIYHGYVQIRIVWESCVVSSSLQAISDASSKLKTATGLLPNISQLPSPQDFLDLETKVLRHAYTPVIFQHLVFLFLNAFLDIILCPGARQEWQVPRVCEGRLWCKKAGLRGGVVHGMGIRSFHMLSTFLLVEAARAELQKAVDDDKAGFF